MSALEEDIVEVDPETKEMLKMLVSHGHTHLIRNGHIAFFRILVTSTFKSRSHKAHSMGGDEGGSYNYALILHMLTCIITMINL